KPEVKAPKIEVDISMPTGEIILPVCEQDGLTLKSVVDDTSLSISDTKMIAKGSFEVKSSETSTESEIAVGGVEIKAEGSEGKTKLSKFQMPKFGMTHSKGKGPKFKTTEADNKAPEVDVHLPSGDISIPKTDSDIQDSDTALKNKEEIKRADGDGEEKEGHFKMPKFKLPSFNWSPKKETTVKPDSGAILEDNKLAAKSGRTDTEVGGTASDDQDPRPALDLEISAGKDEQKSPIKKPQFVMPKISLSKIKVPKSQTHSPKVEAGATIPKTQKDGDDSIQIPDIERSHSKRTEEGAQISIKPAAVKISTLEFSKTETGASQTDKGVISAKIDAAVPASEGSFQQVVLKPSSDDDFIQKTEEDIESPEEKEVKLKEEHEIKAEEVQTEEQQGWFKMPKFRIPAFGRTSSKEKKGDADVERIAEITIGKEGIQKLGESVKGSGVSLPKMEGDISLSAESTDSRVNIPKTETYADIVKRGTEGQKMHTSEFVVSSTELTKPEISVSKIDRDSSSPSKLPICTLSLQEHKVKSQDTEIPKTESTTELEASSTAEMQFQKLEGSIGLTSPTRDQMDSSARITEETMDKSQDGLEVNIKIPKLKIPRFTFKALPTEADVSVSKVVLDQKRTISDIEVVHLQASSAVLEETPETLEGNIQKAKSKILTLTEPDIKTAQMTATIDSSLSNAGQDIHWSYVEGQEVSEIVEPEHVAIERCEIYTTEIVKESEILSSEVKTATLGFSLLKVKLPESHSDLEVLVQEPSSVEDASMECSGKSFGADVQRPGSAEIKPCDKPHTETEGSSRVIGLPKLKTFAVEVEPSGKPEESHPDKSPEEITTAPLSKDEDVAEALEDEEKYITNEKEKTDSKRSPGRFKFWLPSIGFSSSGDETSSDSKTEVKKIEEMKPEDMKPSDTSVSDSSKQTEKTGWFRFPKLGFSSPSKKAKTVDKEEIGHKERRISDEDSPSDKPEVFFDAQETLSPKETTEGEKVEIDGTSSNVPVSRTIVTSSARTELILLEEEK
ncbi:Protein AHNAK2, partial [Anas platyrhynchos]